MTQCRLVKDEIKGKTFQTSFDFAANDKLT